MVTRKNLYDKLKHCLNPMHIYCRLCNFLKSDRWAAKIAIWYEYRIWIWLKPLISILRPREDE